MNSTRKFYLFMMVVYPTLLVYGAYRNGHEVPEIWAEFARCMPIVCCILIIDILKYPKTSMDLRKVILAAFFFACPCILGIVEYMKTGGMAGRSVLISMIWVIVESIILSIMYLIQRKEVSNDRK